jgi:hypothetical protein
MKNIIKLMTSSKMTISGTFNAYVFSVKTNMVIPYKKHFTILFSIVKRGLQVIDEDKSRFLDVCTSHRGMVQTKVTVQASGECLR